jgi:hypothetical protein
MQKRAIGLVFLILSLALLAGALQAQTAAPPKSPIYVYVSTWAAPRAQRALLLRQHQLPILDFDAADVVGQFHAVVLLGQPFL